MFCLLATAIATPLTVMEPDVLVGSAPNWLKIARASSDDEVNVVFVLKHGKDKMAKLEKTFWAVSDPKDARYGQHMTQEEMVELMAPDQSVLDSILTWINAHGVRSVDVSAHKDLIEVVTWNFGEKAKNYLIMNITRSCLLFVTNININTYS